MPFWSKTSFRDEYETVPRGTIQTTIFRDYAQTCSQTYQKIVATKARLSDRLYPDFQLDYAQTFPRLQPDYVQTVPRLLARLWADFQPVFYFDL